MKLKYVTGGNYVLWNGMRIYFHTTYFYQLRFLKHMGKNWLPISICLWDPKWYDGMNFKPFVPKEYEGENDCEMCIKQHEDDPMYDGGLNCNYIKRYRDQLSGYQLDEKLDMLIKESLQFYSIQLHENAFLWKEVHLLFVGYEVPEKKCSERFTLSKWINDEMKKLGTNEDVVNEWKYR